MYFFKIASAASRVLGGGAAGCLASGDWPPTAGTSNTVVPSGMSDGNGSAGPSSVPSNRAASCSDSSAVGSATLAGSGGGSDLGAATLFGIGVLLLALLPD